MPKTEIAVCDIDDTLLMKGVHPMGDNIKKLQALPYPVYLVTGRSHTQEARTRASLRSAGIKFSGLLMSPGDGTDKAANDASKVNHVRQLVKAYTVDIAIDNDNAMLRQYAKLGIQHIVNPSAPSWDNDNGESPEA